MSFIQMTTLIISIFAHTHLWAKELNIAVASNFAVPMKALVASFVGDSNQKIKVIIGSSGKHYAQIKNGAPFDIFFSADTLRPNLLEKERLIVKGSRFTYALGKLALWSGKKTKEAVKDLLISNKNVDFISIANPKLAPYGAAAKETLQGLKLWESYKNKIVRGENVAQAFNFVKNESASMGFVAYSQVLQLKGISQKSLWVVPQNLYQPIEQQAVLLKDSHLAQEFLQYIKSKKSQRLIHGFGYGTKE